MRHCPSHAELGQLSVQDVFAVDISDQYPATVDLLYIPDQSRGGFMCYVDFRLLSNRKAIEGGYIDVFFDESVEWSAPTRSRVTPILSPVECIFRTQIMEMVFTQDQIAEASNYYVVLNPQLLKSPICPAFAPKGMQIRNLFILSETQVPAFGVIVPIMEIELIDS